MISVPAIYRDYPIEDYYRDPCPTPSLTQSIVKILLDRSPLHAWHAHPRLNPDWRADDPTKFDLGNTAHALLIGRGKHIVPLDYEDWRSKDARAKREEAQAAGKLAVLAKQFVRADRMVKAAREQLEAHSLGDLFRRGDGEVMLAWQDGAIWCRQLLDWLTLDCRTVVDYKTTDFSVAPHALPRLMINAGWPIQAAMAERGLRELDPENAGRRRFLFVVQECEPPYGLNVVQLTEGVLTMGHKMLAHAMDIWADCLRADRFPGYPREIMRPEYPGWAEQQWLDREISDAARERRPQQIDPEILMAG